MEIEVHYISSDKEMEASSETPLEALAKEVHCRRHLGNTYDLNLINHGDSISWILKHIDYFVSQSRGNKSLTGVTL